MLNRRYLSAIALVGALFVGACGDDDPTGSGLAAPTGLTATPDTTSVALSWTASTGSSAYSVERQAVGGSFSEVATGVAGTSYTDTGLTAGTVYVYRVKATDGTDISPASETVTVQTLSAGSGPGVAAADLVGNINGTRTLSADTTYTLKGVVQVQDGGILNIPAGTTVLGDKATQGTLLVLPGGMVNANGTSTDPVVFTSSQPAGSREKGDWGGVIINGRSICNFPAGQCIGEGNTGVYGGSMNNDNSGTLRYVRIEWAGIEFSPGNELNGLTLNGVGSGTTLEYIQSHGGLDDGVEFFGGTVNLKHAIVTRASDDSFDWSTGWAGMGQFWIVQQDPDDGDQGWEVDNNEDDFDATPRTFGTVYNYTLVGKSAASGTSNNSDIGILFRRGYSGDHGCGVVMGFGESGLDIDDVETVVQANGGNLTMNNTIFYQNGRDSGADFDPDSDKTNPADTTVTQTDFEATWAASQTAVTAGTDPQLTRPYDITDPDFSPTAGSPLLAACNVPANPFFTSTSYWGAVAGASDTWYLGWTTFADN